MPTLSDPDAIATHRNTLKGAIMEWRIGSTDTDHLTDEAESALWDTWETEIDGWTTDRLEKEAKIARERIGRDESAWWRGEEVEVLYDGRRRKKKIEGGSLIDTLTRLSELIEELDV